MNFIQRKVDIKVLGIKITKELPELRSKREIMSCDAIHKHRPATS